MISLNLDPITNAEEFSSRELFIQNEFVQVQECQLVEYKMFKQPLNENRQFIIKKIVTSFLNASGGSLFIGISDQQEVKGFNLLQDTIEQMIEQLQQIISCIHPCPTYNMDYEIFIKDIIDDERKSVENLKIIEIRVNQFRQQSVYTFEEIHSEKDYCYICCFIRRDDSSVVMHQKQLKELTIQRANLNPRQLPFHTQDNQKQYKYDQADCRQNRQENQYKEQKQYIIKGQEKEKEQDLKYISLDLQKIDPEIPHQILVEDPVEQDEPYFMDSVICITDVQTQERMMAKQELIQDDITDIKYQKKTLKDDFKRCLGIRKIQGCDVVEMIKDFQKRHNKEQNRPKFLKIKNFLIIQFHSENHLERWVQELMQDLYRKEADKKISFIYGILKSKLDIKNWSENIGDDEISEMSAQISVKTKLHNFTIVKQQKKCQLICQSFDEFITIFNFISEFLDVIPSLDQKKEFRFQ